jgi:hypothetical protein
MQAPNKGDSESVVFNLEDTLAALEAMLEPRVGDADLQGLCQFEIAGEGGGIWTLEVEAGRTLLSRGANPLASSVVNLSIQDLVRCSRGQDDPVRLFYAGRARLRGDVSLVMRLVDRWSRA